jgi:hypothetical protein
MSKRIRLGMLSMVSGLAIAAVWHGVSASEEKGLADTAKNVDISLFESGPVRFQEEMKGRGEAVVLKYAPVRQVFSGGKVRYFAQAGPYLLAVEDAKKLVDLAEKLRERTVDPKQFSGAGLTLKLVRHEDNKEYGFDFVLEPNEDKHLAWKLRQAINLKALAEVLQDVEAMKAVKPLLKW